MGGGYYDRDVGSTRSGSGFGSSSAYTSDADEAMGRRSMDRGLVPKGRTLSCEQRNPIVIAMDVTGSMGSWSKVIYDKMPMLFGQIMMQGYLPDPAISFAAIGDAPRRDSAPIQVCDFAQGDTLDSWLTRLYLEGGGGSNEVESYTLVAQAYLDLATYPNLEGKPYFFFTGDEGFFDQVESWEINEFIGSSKGSLSSLAILEELLSRYHVFMVHKPYGYDSSDRQIVRQWSRAIGEERILHLDDPKAVVDTILGAIALQSGARDLDSYTVDLLGRGQSAARVRDVKGALGKLSASTAIIPVATAGVLPTSSGRKRSGGTKRLPS